MPLFSSSNKNDPNLRKVQVVSCRLAFSNGYSPADIEIPEKADPSLHHHLAVRVEVNPVLIHFISQALEKKPQTNTNHVVQKIPNGGDLSDPNTWDYFGLARINREAYFDESALRWLMSGLLLHFYYDCSFCRLSDLLWTGFKLLCVLFIDKRVEEM
ncbi:hypothetical protein BDW69DRAFT_182616 [Aspergillus filifer]